MYTPLRILAPILVLLIFNNCYSCRGIILPTGVGTVAIPNFEDNVTTAHPPTLALEATEALKLKMQNQARLEVVQSDADIEFKGTLVDFRVSSEAPRPGEFTRLNRLTIVTAVEYINHLDPENEEVWASNFSFFFDFPGDTPLSTVQDDAIVEILDQITEQIINKAFTEDW